MRLKRGAQRESCDFCHGRKIKCDRPARARQGHSSCSPCALRELQCRLDDSNDVRIRRRRPQATDRGDRADEPLETPRSVAAHHAGLGREGSNAASPLPPNYDDFLLDAPFDLSAENILFLDQIFLGDYGASTWDNQTPTVMEQHDALLPASSRRATAAAEEHSPSLARFVPHRQPPSWLDPDLDPFTFMAALDAYFCSAAQCLPIIFEDAFWQDYHAGHCSRALAYAVACRGMPFTSSTGKWDTQQALAGKFRESFLEAQQSAAGEGTIRLDDMEALALMVGFVYDNAATPSLCSNLGHLFLTHDSLVLMTLRSGMHGEAAASDASATLARAGERRVLLFWHVYGLDAFHSLDRKRISHINDDRADGPEDTLPLEAGGYLDAMLSLAIIARRIMQTMCGIAARRRGIKHEDVVLLYDQLGAWKRTSCPPHLRIHEDGDGRIAVREPDVSGTSAAGTHIQLHRAVLWLLEVNCYLQIESCVSDRGLQDSATLQAEAVVLRVEAESVRALNTGVEILRWARRVRDQGRDVRQLSLADLAPSVVRDIWAGLCFWCCTRGAALASSGSAVHLKPGQVCGQASTGVRPAVSEKRRLDSYLDAAQLLRDEVATATSHRDTKDIVDRLDQQLALLKGVMRLDSRTYP